VTPSRLVRRERLFFVITGLVEGMLTVLTLAAGKMLHPEESITGDLALRIGLAAGFPTAVVFFAAEYARQRQELLRMAHQLNLTRRERLADGKLGRQAWRESSVSALVSGLCSFGGAAIPLAIASVIPGSGWPAIAVTVGCLGGLGAGIGYTTASCRGCWALALMIAGGLLAGLGNLLHVV
jgi:VIT1/CCC1 family predicted Fe2+/Mn2+ transporter